MAVVTMSSRINLEKKNMDPVEILDLNLDGCAATEIEGLSNEFSNLQSLSLQNVGLKTINGFPALPKLRKLNLADNPIVDGLDALCGCINLTSLNLSGNMLKDLKDLNSLSELKNLVSLDLNDCELARLDNYRNEIFNLLPGLKYLNGLDKNGEEATGNHEHKNGVAVNKSGDHASHSCSENEEEDETDGQEVGLAALQGEDQLEDDEEDYVPGEDDDDEIDDDDDDDSEDDEEDDDEDELDEDEIANLSASGVTEPRRATKRPILEGDDVDENRKEKCIAQDKNGDEVLTNGGENEEFS